MRKAPQRFRLFSDWSKCPLRSGISTKRVIPSSFTTHLPDYQRIRSNYWRDVPSKAAILERLDAYFKPKELSFCKSTLDIAVDAVRAKFRGITVRPLSCVEAWKSVPKTTSPGLPYTMSGLRTKQDAWFRISKDNSYIWRQLSRKTYPKVYPCGMGARRALRRRPVNKPRLVWVYPGDVLSLEAQYAVPLIEQLKEKCPWLGYSINWLDGGVTRDRLLAHCRDPVLCVDYTSFDANVVSVLLYKAWSILQDIFSMNEVQELGFYFITDYFVHTPIATYDRVVQKHRGVPSGSYFTQIIDSIVNMIYSEYAMARQPAATRWRYDDPIFMGDDSWLPLVNYCEVDTLLDRYVEYSHELGGEVSADKSSIYFESDDDYSVEPFGEFLSRTIYYGPPHLGFDYDKAIGSLIFPEDEDQNEWDLVQRCIGLIWAYGFNYDYWNTCFRLGLETKRKAIRRKVKYIPRRKRGLEFLIFLGGLEGIPDPTGPLPTYEQVCKRYGIDLDPKWNKLSSGSFILRSTSMTI